MTFKDDTANTPLGRRARLGLLSRNSFAARLAAFAWALVVLTWAVLGLDFWQRDAKDAAAAGEQAATIARAMDERVVRTVRLADQLLRLVGAELQSENSWSDARAVERILRRLEPQLDEILTISLVDARGLCIGNSNPALTIGANYGDSDFFQAHAAAPALGLFVEKPLVGPVSGQRVFTVSRRVTASDGGFLGVLVAAIRTDALAADFASAAIGQRGAAHLLHVPSQRIIVRQPDHATRFGQVLDPPAPQDQTAGIFRGVSALDGEERIYAYRRVGELPLAVSVGLSTAELHANLRHEFIGHLLLALLLNAVVVAGSVFIFAAYRREFGLDAANRRWQKVFEHAGWGVAVISADGKTLQQMNPAYARMLGYSVEELTGQAIDVVYPADSRKDIPDRIGQVLAAGHCRFEMPHIHRDGRVFPVLIDATAVRGEDDAVLFGVVNVQDITELRGAQDEMRVAREFFQQTFDAATVAIAIAEFDGRYIQVNQAMCEFTGYSESELLTMNYIDITHPDDLERNVFGRQSLLDSSTQSFQMEKRYLRKDGRAVWGIVALSLVTFRKGMPLCWLTQIVDIDARKQSLRALAESRQHLRDLASHQEEILEGERKHIAREVHDELGQLLTALKMDISLLRLRFGENTELLPRLTEMRSLVEKTIDVVRNVASNLRPAALDHGLVPALDWLADDFAQRWSIPCKLIVGAGETALDDLQSTAIFRVVQESLTNVARHAGASEVIVSLHESEHVLHLSVKDDGSGFDARDSDCGTGFGLFGMRERLLALGGALRIDSAPDAGTCVSIELPLSKGAAP
jgi:PAS domain S-box-containing protein